VRVSFSIPDELAEHVVPPGKDPSRAALEALAIEGYRSEQLTEAEVERLLGFETRSEVHAFLKERGAYLHYSMADAERDRETAHRARKEQQKMLAERRAG
jgi:hypothetical protein